MCHTLLFWAMLSYMHWCRALHVPILSGAKEHVGQSMGPVVAQQSWVQSEWPAAEWGQLLLQERWEQRRLVIQIAD